MRSSLSLEMNIYLPEPILVTFNNTARNFSEFPVLKYNEHHCYITIENTNNKFLSLTVPQN